MTRRRESAAASKPTKKNAPALTANDGIAHRSDLAQIYLNSFWNLMLLSICAMDRKLRIVERNDGFLDWAKATLGRSPQVGDTLLEHLPPQARRSFKTLFQNALKGEHATADVRLDLKEEKWVFARVCPMFSQDQKIIGVLTTLRDVTEQKRLEAENAYNRQLYLTLARHIPDSNMFLLDKDGCFLVAEGTEMRKAGIDPESLSGKSVKDAMGETFFNAIEPLMKKVFRGKTGETEVAIDKQIYAVQLVPVRNEARKIYATMGVMRNVTEAKAIERKLTESLQEKERALQDLAEANEIKTKLLAELRAQTEFLEKQTREDALTGLYNRRYLNLQLEQEFKRAKRYGNPLSVVMCDIDHFKRINDTFSHQVGDEVLKTLGRIFKAYSRSVDTVARFGGEEFVLVLPETPKEKAVVLCEKLRSAVEHYPWSEIHPELKVTISFGVSDNVRLGHYEKMLAEADEKLYEAKNAGRNRVVY